MDYATLQRSPYATMTAIMQGFVAVGWVEMMRAIARSSQEVFDTVLADAMFRQDSPGARALKVEPGRRAGWRVPVLNKILLGRVNRY